MIFLGFLLTFGIFLIFAFMSGNVFYFINWDSLLISPLAGLIFAVCTFRWKELLLGVKTMFLFSVKRHLPDRRVSELYTALMLVSASAGVISTIQGFISYSLSGRDMDEIALAMPFTEAFAYSVFSTAYGIMYAVLLFYPVSLLNRENGK